METTATKFNQKTLTLRLGSRRMYWAERACRAASQVTEGQEAKFRALANRMLEAHADVVLTYREAKLVRRALARATVEANSYGECSKMHSILVKVAERLDSGTPASLIAPQGI